MRNTIYITCALCFIAFCLGWSVRGCDNEQMQVRDTITDTVTFVKYDTVTYRQPVAVDSVVVRYKMVKVELKENNFLESDDREDSFPTKDSVEVEIPITQKTYKDSTYEAWVSGYEPNLDSIQVYPRTEYRTVTNTIKVRDDKRWGIGIHCGVGYGIGGFTPYIGIGVQYNLIRWRTRINKDKQR